jgi:hypothetical protein
MQEMSRNLWIEVGPFAIAQKNLEGFCHNLFLTHAINECALHMTELEKEYSDAVLHGDEVLIEQKRVQIQVHQSSLLLTAHMFNETDEIST